MRVVMRVTFQYRALAAEIDVTPTTGFSENDHQPRISPFIGNPDMQFTFENQADVMSYFDHYVPPKVIEIVVEQTNLYANNRLRKCLALLQNMHVVKNGNQ